MEKTSHPVKQATVTNIGANSEKNLSNQIAELAYYKFESRGYQPGFELQDWLDAETEIHHSKTNQ